MIDLINPNENILYPTDLHNNGQWFAKICLTSLNAVYCLISSNEQITRVIFFPNQDSLICSLCVSSNHQWLIVIRQHALEIYQLCTSLISSIEDIMNVTSFSWK